MEPSERAHLAVCAAYNALDVSNSRVEKALCKAIEEAEKDVRKDYRVLLQNILDFIGLDGIVNSVYSRKRDSLCKVIQEAMK